MARALVSRAPILILDEATSSVDTTTEQRLQQATLRLLEGRTCFLIAHRPSTIRRADRIFVVGERGIVESGTYDELMKSEEFIGVCFNESVVLNVIYDQQAIVLLTLRLRWGVLSYSDEFLITCCYFDP